MLVEPPTEKPGTILAQVQVPVVAWDFSESTSSADSLTVASVPAFGHTKILHTLTGMGSMLWWSKLPSMNSEVIKK